MYMSSILRANLRCASGIRINSFVPESSSAPLNTPAIASNCILELVNEDSRTAGLDLTSEIVSYFTTSARCVREGDVYGILIDGVQLQPPIL